MPEKLHVTLLNLLGIELEPPVAATTRLRFRLSAPPTEPVQIPAGETEVGTIRTANEEAVIFQTTEDFTIPPARPTAYAVKRGGAVKDVGVAGGIAKPKGPDQTAFGSPPKAGDALYIGFDVPLANMLLEVDVDCSQARGAGVDPEDPPLRWEVSVAEEESGWLEAEVVEDLTGGFNYGSGKVTIQLPDRHTAVPIAGHRAYWVCCRLDTKTRSGAAAAASYTHPPEIHEITAAPIGAIIPAAHSARETGEVIGDERRHAGPDLRAPLLPDPRPDRRRSTSRSSTRTRATWEQLGAGRVVRREQADRHALRAQRRRRPGRARPGDPDARRQLAPVRRRAEEGRDAADEPLPPRRRPPRQRRRRARSPC